MITVDGSIDRIDEFLIINKLYFLTSISCQILAEIEVGFIKNCIRIYIYLVFEHLRKASNSFPYVAAKQSTIPFVLHLFGLSKLDWLAVLLRNGVHFKIQLLKWLLKDVRALLHASCWGKLTIMQRCLPMSRHCSCISSIAWFHFCMHWR